jgi:hypothetical protein
MSKFWRKPSISAGLEGFNMIKHAYGRGKLRDAMLSLTGAQNQKRRLECAILVNLVPITPETDLPETVQPHFVAFMNEMQSYRTRESEGAVWEVILHMDDGAIEGAISRIFGFYDAVNSSIITTTSSATANKAMDANLDVSGSISRH